MTQNYDYYYYYYHHLFLLSVFFLTHWLYKFRITDTQRYLQPESELAREVWVGVGHHVRSDGEKAPAAVPRGLS